MQEGISLGELWKARRKRIWLILGLSVLFTAVVIVMFVFWLNPRSATYRLEFTVSFPDSVSMKYPDGTPFYYQDMISLSSLEEVQKSDSRFSAIDVTEMTEKDAISISESRQDDGTALYTLSVQQCYFSGRSLATSFLRAIANVPVELAKSKAGNATYLLDRTVFESAALEGRIELLAAQKTSLLAQYDQWIAFYRENYIVEGKTLLNRRAEVSVIFDEALKTELLVELKQHGYVSLELLPERIAKLQEERALNEKKIKELQNAFPNMPSGSDGSQSDSYQRLVEIMAELIMRNVEIDSEIAALTEENVAAFESLIDTEYEKLQAAAVRIQAVTSVLYQQESRASFITSNALEEGGTDLILVGIGGFIFLFLVAGAIICARELPRAKTQETSPEEH